MKQMLDTKLAIEECRDYINLIPDFYIEQLGGAYETEDVITQLIERENAKFKLHEFLFECEKEMGEGPLSFMQFLNDRKSFWITNQAELINKLNIIVNRNTGIDRTRYENQRMRFHSFFYHISTIIELLLTRLTGSQLSEPLELHLKEIGLIKANDSDPSLKLTEKIVPIDDSSKLPISVRKQRNGTMLRYAQYKTDVINFESLEGKGRVAAIEATAQKHNVCIDTIERALGMRK